MCRIFAATTMDIVYGMTLSGPDDDFIVRMEYQSALFNQMKVPGAFLVDTFPILRHIPAWCPGGAARRFAASYKAVSTALRDEPFEVVKQDIVRCFRPVEFNADAVDFRREASTRVGSPISCARSSRSRRMEKIVRPESCMLLVLPLSHTSVSFLLVPERLLLMSSQLASRRYVV